jgi:hypothetical protein
MESRNEQVQNQRVWRSLTEAGLLEIKLDEFPEMVKKVKRVAIGWLGELLERQTAIREQESVAHSLGTLKRLETSLQTDTPPTPQ